MRPQNASSPPRPPSIPRVGVRIAGTGSCVPTRVVTNRELAGVVDTSDEWIVQRTGIHERRVVDWTRGESHLTLCTESLRAALADARVEPRELDLIIVGTVSQDMRVPSAACMVAQTLGAGHCAAWDLNAACSGFVFSINVAHDLIRVGTHRTVGVIGCDALSSIVDYTNRGVCILFGDAGGAAVLRATDDTSKGIVAQVTRTDGSRWRDLYMPGWHAHIADHDVGLYKTACLQMNGREVYKFAVTTFGELIQETLDQAGLRADDVDMYVCHQSNARILESARERFGIPADKLYMNIDRIGNTSAGSVALCLDELRRAGRVREGEKVMLVAFGAGMTWGSCLWQL